MSQRLTVIVRPLYPRMVLANGRDPVPVRVLNALMGVKGDKGDTGDTGPAGSDANVTNANVNTALQADAAASRTALGLGTAATQAATAFDAAGAADAAQAAAIAAAASDATTKANAAQSAAEAYADTLVTGLFDDRGSYDASSGTFPTTGGSGTAGAVVKGDVWLISVAGTLGTRVLSPGDAIRAMTDAPGQVESNWAFTENNLNFAPEPAQTAASQAEAEAGTGTSIRSWTPVRIWQAIAAKLTLGTWISGATGKTTPVDADTLPLSDSAASSALKKLTWANIKATLKTYFDTVYTLTGLGVSTFAQTLLDDADEEAAMKTLLQDGRYGFYKFNDLIGVLTDAVHGANPSGTGAAVTATGSTSSEDGTADLAMGTVATNRSGFGSPGSGFWMGNGVCKHTSKLKVLQLSDATNTYTLYIGFINAYTGDPSNGAYFRYTHSVNGGRFQAVLRNASVETAIDTGMSPNTSAYQKFRVETDATAATITFYIDDVQVAQSSSNAPGGCQAASGINAIRSAGTASFSSARLDYIKTFKKLTTPRT